MPRLIAIVAIVVVALGETYLLASTGRAVAALAFGVLAPAGVLWEQARLRQRGPVGVEAADLVLGCLALMQLAILYLTTVAAG